jgi:hypothetical protein
VAEMNPHCGDRNLDLNCPSHGDVLEIFQHMTSQQILKNCPDLMLQECLASYQIWEMKFSGIHRFLTSELGTDEENWNTLLFL